MLSPELARQLLDEAPELHFVLDTDVEDALHDPLRWECFMYWLPHLGPTSMVFIVDVIRQWQLRCLGDKVIVVAPNEYAPLLGVQTMALRRLLSRLLRFNIITVDDGGFVHLNRWLPRLPNNELNRHSDEYRHAYEQYAAWCSHN